MHQEHAIPIIKLILGTGKNKNPVYIMTTLNMPFATFWLPLLHRTRVQWECLCGYLC